MEAPFLLGCEKIDPNAKDWHFLGQRWMFQVTPSASAAAREVRARV
jgi:hypothetical protein